MSASDEEANELIRAVRANLERGYQYFHPATDAPLLTVAAVIKCMVDETAVLIRTPEVDIDFRPCGGFKAASLAVRNEVTSGATP